MARRTRIVVIASTVEAGRERYPFAAAIVTPRSRDAARGITADRLLVMGDMRDHPDIDELRALAAPALATSRKSRTVETVVGSTARTIGGDEG